MCEYGNADMVFAVSYILCRSKHTHARYASYKLTIHSNQVIVGTVVTRSPHLTVASSALHELSLAVELFEKTAVQSQRAKTALVCRIRCLLLIACSF